MSYAETQDEIIRTQRYGRPPANPHLAGAPTSPSVRVTLPAAPVPPPAASAPAAAAPTPAPARPIVAAQADDGADADLAAAVAAARRLRFTTEVEQIVVAAGVTVEQVRGRGKGRELVEVRRIVAACLRRRGCSLPEIGRVLNRDHTSVLYMLRMPARVTGLYEEMAS
jgi:hypothetical protein